jgi:hypothetical protein
MISESWFAIDSDDSPLRNREITTVMLESQSRATGRNSITLELAVRQDRHPIHPKLRQKILAAQELGMRAIRGPARIGDGFSVRDDGAFYELDESVLDLIMRREKANKVATAIEARGLGRALGLSLGRSFSERDGVPDEWWLQGLKHTIDKRERLQVAKAIAEWADADSIAAHIGYGHDFFCTHDVGKGAKISIFTPENKEWLTATYGVTFVTLSELCQRL